MIQIPSHFKVVENAKCKGWGRDVLTGVGWGWGTGILGICLLWWLIHMVKISSKLEVFQLSGGQKPPLRGLTK